MRICVATRVLTRALAAIILLVAVLPSSAHAQNAPQPFKDWRVTSLSDALRAEPRVQCEAVVSMTTYEFSILSATMVPPSGSSPQFCRILGQILPEVRFELSLPAQWNGRLYMFGNGGFAGEGLDLPGRVATRNAALQRGFAVVQTNTGHDQVTEPLGTFAVNSQKLIDYAYRAVHVTVVTAKRLSEAYYGTPVRRAYFNGCSTGGRQGLMSAQRFPDDFDGILVGAPVLDLTGTMVTCVSNQQTIAGAGLAADQLDALAQAIYTKCDASDGLTDGVIDDPRRCAFSPASDLPRCGGQAGSGCFTASQVEALTAIYRGRETADPHTAFGWPVGSEIRAPSATGPVSGWIPWFFSAQAGGQPIGLAFGESFMRYMAFGKPDPTYDWKTFNVDADPRRMDGIRAILDATNPDLSRFRARGGKILMYFGWADPALNPLMGIDYYERVTKRMGPATPDFFKLYMVPGMFHCNGGIATSVFDVLTPLVEWVENGSAPGSIVAGREVDGKTVRTRPLCPYPQVARYRGAGSIDEAENFTCTAPDRASAPPVSSRSN